MAGTSVDESGQLINLTALIGLHENFKCIICYLQRTEALADNANAQTQSEFKKISELFQQMF